MSSIVPTAWNDTINHLLVDSYVVLRGLGGSRDNFTFATTFAELSRKKQSETHTHHMANVCFVARSEAEQMFEQTQTYSNTIFAGFLLNRQLRGPLYQVPYNLIYVLLRILHSIIFYSFLFYYLLYCSESSVYTATIEHPGAPGCRAWARMTASFLSGVVWPQMKSSCALSLSFLHLKNEQRFREYDKAWHTMTKHTIRNPTRLLQMSRPLVGCPSLKIFVALCNSQGCSGSHQWTKSCGLVLKS